MANKKTGDLDAIQARAAPSGSDNEKDAGSERSAGTPVASDAPLEQAELKQLRIRVVALENVLVALLAQASERQLELVPHDGRAHFSEAWIHAASIDSFRGRRNQESAQACRTFPIRQQRCPVSALPSEISGPSVPGHVPAAAENGSPTLDISIMARFSIACDRVSAVQTAAGWTLS